MHRRIAKLRVLPRPKVDLRFGAGRLRRGGRRSSLLSIPGIIVSLAPVATCASCLPALAGLFGAVGLGFVLKTAYLLPLTVVFLALALVGLAWRQRSRQGYGPLVLGALGAASVLLGKFAFASQTVGYAGTSLLVAASVWNAWSWRSDEGAGCPTPPASGAPH